MIKSFLLHPVLPVIVLSLCVACNQQDEKPVHEEQNIKEVEGKPSVFMETELERDFAEPEGKERFVLRLKGDSLATAKGVFYILTETGDTLYQIEFPAAMLGPTGSHPIDSTKAEEAIRNRFNQFFEASRFRPLNRDAMPHEEGIIDADLYEEIMNTPQGWSFYYVIGYEDVRTIAYAPSKKKIVLLHNCC